jgi:uncharacterized protein (DUF4415 family)
MKQKRSASSPREKRIAASVIFTKPPSKRQKAELVALTRRPDASIDYSDIPPVRTHGKLEVGKFYRPIKKLVSLRIDVDVLAWFKSQGSHYQTRINLALRREMESLPEPAKRKRT